MPFNAAERYAKRKLQRALDERPDVNSNEPLRPKRAKRVPSKSEKPNSQHPGTFFHKPGCQCAACKSRNWNEEAVLGSTRTKPDASSVAPGDVIQVDLPQLVTTRQMGGHKRTIRDTISEWVGHRFVDPSLTTTQIAEKMGVGPKYLMAIISKAGKEGWLKFDNPMERIEHEIIPKTLDNISEFLDQKDRTVTIEAAKGTIFKQFQEHKGISDNKPMVLALKIETAAPTEQAVVIQGNIVGRAKQISGE